jgi:hypothetical protein
VEGTVGMVGLAYNGRNIIVDVPIGYPYNFNPIFEADYNGYFVITINYLEDMVIGSLGETANGIYIDSESMWH